MLENLSKMVPKWGPKMESKSSEMMSWGHLCTRVAPKLPPDLLRDRFWTGFGIIVGTIVDRFSNIVEVISRCVVQEHVANTYLQNHMDSNKTCTRHHTQNHTAFKAKGAPNPRVLPRTEHLLEEGPAAVGVALKITLSIEAGH